MISMGNQRKCWILGKMTWKLMNCTETVRNSRFPLNNYGYRSQMKIGNIIASAGLIIGFIGIMCLPLFNLRELPFIGDAGYPKGGGWICFVQTGILTRPGIILMISGGILYGVAKLLPKKYWETRDSLLDKEIKGGYQQKGKDMVRSPKLSNRHLRDV
jgi:hypothetical protein